MLETKNFSNLERIGNLSAGMALPLAQWRQQHAVAGRLPSDHAAKPFESRWLASELVAALRRNHRLASIGMPGCFASERAHIADNGFDPEAQTLVHGAVGPEPGAAKFPRLPDPANDFGSRPIEAAEGDYAGREFAETIEVEVLGIADLLQREPLWDLVHIDVQGGETALCERAIDLLAERARWVIIGTHSRKIDGDLVDMFTRHGWKLEHEKPSRFIFRPAMPTLDAMTTHDGTQVWRNPRIA